MTFSETCASAGILGQHVPRILKRTLPCSALAPLPLRTGLIQCIADVTILKALPTVHYVRSPMASVVEQGRAPALSRQPPGITW